jgi:hypothetical protein
MTDSGIQRTVNVEIGTESIVPPLSGFRARRNRDIYKNRAVKYDGFPVATIAEITSGSLPRFV